MPTAEEIITRWRTPIYSLAHRIVGKDADSEDLAQEILLRACSQLDRYDPSRPFEPWLFRIATNLIFRHLRDRKRRRARETAVAEARSAEAATNDTTEDDVERRESIAIVQRELAAMPDEQRALLTLRFVHGQSLATIADGAGLAKSTVQSRVEKAVATLRARLASVVGAGAAAVGAMPSAEAMLESMPMVEPPVAFAGEALVATAKSTTAVALTTSAGGAVTGTAMLAMIGIAFVAIVGGTLVGALVAGGMAGDGANQATTNGRSDGAPNDDAPNGNTRSTNALVNNTPAITDNTATTNTNETDMPDQLPALTRIVLATNDTERATAFYRALLNAELTPEDWGGNPVARGTMAGVSVLILPQAMAGIRAEDNRHQLGFTVADLRAAVDAGLAAGGSMDEDWKVQEGPEGLTAAIRDPDGNSIELFQRK